MECSLDDLTNWLLYGTMTFGMLLMLAAIYLLVREVRRLRRFITYKDPDGLSDASARFSA